MKQKTAKDGRIKKFVIYLNGVLVVWALAGCQPNYNDILPPPTVRPVQRWHKPAAVTVTPGKWKHQTTTNYQASAGWIPPQKWEDKNRWQGIVIHHSADDSGDAAEFHYIHQQKGWDGLGYHFVIDNGSNNHGKKDGEVEIGYRWRQQTKGAHCRVNPYDNNYWNEHTIGICLVGNFERSYPTEAQMRSLVKLIHFLQQRYHIPTSKIIGHGDVKPTKCPGRHFSFQELHERLGS